MSVDKETFDKAVAIEDESNTESKLTNIISLLKLSIEQNQSMDYT